MHALDEGTRGHAVDQAGRARRLLEARNLKMARSAHAYVRGSTTKFYEWLANSGSTLPAGPSIWICGDCHMGNLGPIADAKGRVDIQIRDLDQTVIGNPAHDLIRLALSLASAARGSDLPGVVTVRILEQLMVGYESALSDPATRVDAEDADSRTVRKLMREATRRRWRHLSHERLNTVRPEVPLGRRFWEITGDERDAIHALFDDDAVHRKILSLQNRDESRVTVVDAAYWMKGCSSLGRLRYAVMLRVGRKSDATLCLVDIKEATGAVAPRDADAAMPRDNAVRVVTGAQALSPYLGERMMATRLLDKAVVVRELMPQDLKLEVGDLLEDEGLALARHLGHVVGRSHARQMDDAVRGEWLATLTRARPSTIDAPTWLWSSVVDLMAIHEAAYLEHCRRYAQRQAA